jgi:hypothetical protein
VKARLFAYACLILALAALAGWARQYLEGPEIRTFTRAKIVPVPVESVKWVEKVKRETVTVPVQVIRHVPAPIADKLEPMGVDLEALHAQGSELVDVLAIPKAPQGGDLALTLNSAGKVSGTFLAKPAPFLEIGGAKEIGAEYDPINSAVTGYYRQDFVRVGRAVIHGRAFATASSKYQRSGVGLALGVSVRF